MVLSSRLLATLTSVLLFVQGPEAQKVAVCPPEGKEIIQGEKWTAVFKANSTKPPLSVPSFSLTLDAKFSQEPTPLGRQLFGIVAEPGENGIVSLSNNTYTFEVTVPSANVMIDGFSSGYTRTSSTHFCCDSSNTQDIQQAFPVVEWISKAPWFYL